VFDPKPEPRTTAYAHRRVLWVTLAVTAVLPVVVGPLGVEMMAFAIAVVGYDLLVGYLGYVSFGQAMFFGMGAFGTAFGVTYFSLSFVPAMLSGMALGVFGAAIVAAVAFRRRGVYFALLTFAFAQVTWTVFLTNEQWTGGNLGLTIDRPPVALPGATVSMDSNLAMVVVAYAVFAAALYAAVRLAHSPFGQVLKGIRENEERMRSLGYDVDRYKRTTFLLAGLYTATGGALYAMHTQFAFTRLLFFTTTGDLLMATIVGGIGTMLGPVYGLYGFVLLRQFLELVFPRWRLLFGVAFVLVVLYYPEGLAGVVTDRLSGRDPTGDDGGDE